MAIELGAACMPSGHASDRMNKKVHLEWLHLETTVNKNWNPCFMSIVFCLFSVSDSKLNADRAFIAIPFTIVAAQVWLLERLLGYENYFCQGVFSPQNPAFLCKLSWKYFAKNIYSVKWVLWKVSVKILSKLAKAFANFYAYSPLSPCLWGHSQCLCETFSFLLELIWWNLEERIFYVPMAADNIWTVGVEIPKFEKTPLTLIIDDWVLPNYKRYVEYMQLFYCTSIAIPLLVKISRWWIGISYLSILRPILENCLTAYTPYCLAIYTTTKPFNGAWKYATLLIVCMTHAEIFKNWCERQND